MQRPRNIIADKSQIDDRLDDYQDFTERSLRLRRIHYLLLTIVRELHLCNQWNLLICG